jgi:hypothetical protein
MHGSQRSLTTINGFPNVLSTVLKKHNSTMVPGSDQKLSTPSADLSRAAIHSEIQQVSPTKSKQVPAKPRSY